VHPATRLSLGAGGVSHVKIGKIEGTGKKSHSPVEASTNRLGVWLKLDGPARYPDMRLLNVTADHMRILDHSLDGRLSSALVEAAGKGEIEVHALRSRPILSKPSSWTLVVRGGDFERSLPVERISGLGVIANIYLLDVIEDLKADLALRVCGAGHLDSLDECLLWNRSRQGDPS